MAKETSYSVNATEAPNPTIHLQVKEGKTAHYEDRAYGDRATLQVSRDEADVLLTTGTVEEVDPNEVPDVSERPSTPPPAARKP